MTFAKCLLVALALWMPAASFAVGVASVSIENLGGAPAPDEASSESEQDAVFLPSPLRVHAPEQMRAIEIAAADRLAVHFVEPSVPPPNGAPAR